jgi:predicted nucleotidyltransferase
VRKLVAEYAPEKVVLFGSYAYGVSHRDSDIDLLIIKDTQESFFNRLTRVRQVVSGLHKGVPFDPIVLTPGEVEARLKVGDQFLEEILERGQLLYAQ